VARLDHYGGGFLRRDVGGDDGEVWQAGDLQHRPGLVVHGAAFTGLLIKNGIAISWTAKVRGETTFASDCGAGAGEDADAYHELHARTCAAVKPVDAIDEIFIAGVMRFTYVGCPVGRRFGDLIKEASLVTFWREAGKRSAEQKQSPQLAAINRIDESNPRQCKAKPAGPRSAW
jgi:hypothetical protein